MKSKLIVALDTDSYEAAIRLVQQLNDTVQLFKVGSQLFTRVGPRIVEFLNDNGKRCFLDLKFHDIPHTVAKAVESAAALQVFMLTLHTCGGVEMLRAAAQVEPRPALLGVTVLTSVGGDVEATVLQRATLALECGLDGVVASAKELAALRAKLGSAFWIVTPGIRPVGSAVGDQKRVVTPSQAIADGANYIVVGRPIIEAADPALAAKTVVDQMSARS